MKPKKILVPVDFSSFSEATTRYALDWAKKYQAEVTLFHVIVMYEADVNEEVHLHQLELLIKSREDEAIAKMERHNSRTNNKGIPLKSVFRRNVSAANAILEYIEEEPHDLIIMNTHGKSGLKNLIYGSVTEKVVRLSPIPVVTFHTPPESLNIRRILAPVDFSDNSKKGVEMAQVLAREHGAKIDYLHTIEQQLHPSFQVIGIESIFILNPELKQISKDKLKEFCHSPDIESEYHIIEGPSAPTIADFAGEHDTDLIVMATHGYTGLDHLLIGSTTERVVRMAGCPVLTVGRREEA